MVLSWACFHANSWLNHFQHANSCSLKSLSLSKLFMQTYQNQNTLMVFYGPKLDKYENSSKDTLTMHTHAHHANSQMAKDIEGKKKAKAKRRSLPRESSKFSAPSYIL